MRNNINKNILLLLFIMAGAWAADLNAQIVVPFKQRTAASTPDQKIYNLKGDFQMIGNKNITAVTYQVDGHNAVDMKYVDIDGDNSTLNSSSATLQFPAETGVNHDCSKIVFAGLYWTGRAHDGTSPNSFMVGETTNDRYNGNSFNGYTLSITAANATGTDGRIATYTFTPANGGNVVVFRFHSWRTGWGSYHGEVTVQVGSGPETTVNGSLTSTSGNNYTFTFSSPYTINTGTETIHINSLRKRRTENSINDNYRVSVTSGGKLLEKRKVQFKKAGQSYYTVTANAADIYYPVQNTETGNYMYAAYAEVTDYVKQHGVGEYFVADMALREGNGGGTGYYGGWGLIVIYENPKMKWRDITIFDGYAYVQGSTTINHELPVSGFRTAQNGDIRIKMGLIAGEGDRGISGDYFEIRNRDDNQWVRLSHSGNSTTNFFNGSIPGTAPRNPSDANNYGLDIAMFEVSNPGNTIIGNNQTSTKFRYGSTQDTYIISTIALAVDAYVPDVRAFVNFSSSTPIDPAGIAPGTEVEYTLQLSNASNEPIDGVSMDIPIPYTATYISSSAVYTPDMTLPGQQPQLMTTSGGSYIRWEVGTLPQPADQSNPPLLATLTFKLKATDNCDLLVIDDCLPRVAVNGKITGVGAYSGQNFSDLQFITGYTEAAGGCDRVPQYGPLSVDINIGNHCPTGAQSPTLIDNKVFSYCQQTEVDIFAAVQAEYPDGTRFYDKFVYSTSNNGVQLATPAPDATEYTNTNDFPNGAADIGAKEYYAIPFGSSTCIWSFTIKVERCSYWVGTTSTDWATASNWSKNTVPSNGEKVEFATAENNPGNPAIRDLVLDQNRTVSSLVNKTNFRTVIPTGKTLVVVDSVVGNATAAESHKLHIQSAVNMPNGSLILARQPANKPVYGTVEMYSKADKSNTPMTWTDDIEDSPTKGMEFSESYRWQYFGVPVEGVSANPTFYGAYLRQYDETYNGDNTQFYQKWRDLNNSSLLEAFKGYEITQDAPATYWISGRLVHGEKTLTLTRNAPAITGLSEMNPNMHYGLGQNIFGNSYTAAINIATITFPDEVEPTVYIYNTGSFAEWGQGSTVSVTTALPGYYLAIPKNVATTIWDGQIPSMQGFLLRFKDSETTYGSAPVTVTLKYGLGDSQSISGNSHPQKSPASNGNARTEGNIAGNLQVMLSGNKTSDVMWLIETPEATSNFEYGYDGEKIFPFSSTATLFAETDDNKALQVSTTNTIDGSFISFKSNSDTEYSMKIVKTDLENYPNLYLIDLLTRTAVRLDDETTYNFTSDMANHKSKRFMIVSTPNISEINKTFANELLDAYLSDNNTIVVNNLTDSQADVAIYDVTGKNLLQQTAAVGTNRISVNLSAGIYIVAVKANDIQNNVKIVIR